MIRKGRREKLCFFPGPFFPARMLLLTMFFALVLFPAFSAPAWATTEPFDESVLAEVQALQELKEKQPEVYQQRILELKGRVKKDVGNWRTQKPEVYQRFMQRGQQRSQQHREFLRQKRPDLYPIYQKRHAQREIKHESAGFNTPQHRTHLNAEPARQPLITHPTHTSPENQQPSLSQSQPSQRQPRTLPGGRGIQRPRMEAGNNDPRAREDRIAHRPGLRPRQPGSRLNDQERQRPGTSTPQGISRQNRREQPRPRDSRQRS